MKNMRAQVGGARGGTGHGLVLVALLAALLTHAGCGGRGSGPPLVQVQGTVTRQGKPLENLMVHFQPESGRPSHGVTDSQGNFTLEYLPDQPGAVQGPHRVFVSFVPPSVEVEMAIFEGRHQHPPEIAAALEKYGDPATTPLTVELTQDDTVNLELY